ncbi:MAG: hypothetical protein KC910_13690 [Candidatus Eremiobacteraeota bacterium]|nr:hypothetical protein [Candidatus Eremiobacteraeota bacterium]
MRKLTLLTTLIIAVLTLGAGADNNNGRVVTESHLEQGARAAASRIKNNYTVSRKINFVKPYFRYPQLVRSRTLLNTPSLVNRVPTRWNETNLARRGIADRAINGQLGNTLRSRASTQKLVTGSQYFTNRPRHFTPIEPNEIPITSYVMEDLAMYVQAKSFDGKFQVEDELAGRNWSTWMASHPAIRKVGRSYVAQAGFYGTLGNDPTVYPLVLQFRLEGSDKAWHVRDVQVVSANRNEREGAVSFVQWVPNTENELVAVELPDVQ